MLRRRALQVDLLDEEIAGAFDALDAGAKGGLLNPMQFSNLLRMMDASQGNLKTELDLFHEFDVENKGAISLADMTNGLRRVVNARGLSDPFVKAVLKGVRAYHERGMVAL